MRLPRMTASLSLPKTFFSCKLTFEKFQQGDAGRGGGNDDRPAPEPSLRMSGAATGAQMESFLVTKIDFTYDDEPGIIYVQNFDPYIKYAMMKRDIDRVPQEDDDDSTTVVVVDSGGGCDAGSFSGSVSAAAFVFALAVWAAGRTGGKRRA
jgi:hypothetical protein